MTTIRKTANGQTRHTPAYELHYTIIRASPLAAAPTHSGFAQEHAQVSHLGDGAKRIHAEKAVMICEWCCVHIDTYWIYNFAWVFENHFVHVVVIRPFLSYDRILDTRGDAWNRVDMLVVESFMDRNGFDF